MDEPRSPTDDDSARLVRAVRQACEQWHLAGLTDLPRRLQAPAAPPARPATASGPGAARRTASLPETSAGPRAGAVAPAPSRAVQDPSDVAARRPFNERLLKDAPTSTVTPAAADPPVAQPSRAVPTDVPPNAFVPRDLPEPQRIAELVLLQEQVRQCRRCSELAETRTQTVFGVGNPMARFLFLGEAPGADEDRLGEPFVGRAGQLLNDIIKACGLKREEIYICNVLRCRPPGNRLPSPAESGNCREYLDGQIGIVNPQYIVCWGTTAARALIPGEQAIGKLRGRFFEYGRSRVLCTYHPSYLLRNPAAKKDVWEDMKLLLADAGLAVPR